MGRMVNEVLAVIRGLYDQETITNVVKKIGRCSVVIGRRTLLARNHWLALVEIIGVVLVTVGVSFWSIPAALILGGLVLASAIEIRGNPTPRMPTIRPPEDVLRATAREAAIVINQERFGIGMVDQSYIDKLSISECEGLIRLARMINGMAKT